MLSNNFFNTVPCPTSCNIVLPAEFSIAASSTANANGNPSFAPIKKPLTPPSFTAASNSFLSFTFVFLSKLDASIFSLPNSKVSLLFFPTIISKSRPSSAAATCCILLACFLVFEN